MDNDQNSSSFVTGANISNIGQTRHLKAPSGRTERDILKPKSSIAGLRMTDGIQLRHASFFCPFRPPESLLQSTPSLPFTLHMC